MNSILIFLALVFVMSSAALAGDLHCTSATDRHHMHVHLSDHSDVVDVVNEGHVLHFALSDESAKKSRYQLPLVLATTHGDMIWKINRDPSGNRLYGNIWLRVIGERVSLNCVYLVSE